MGRRDMCAAKMKGKSCVRRRCPSLLLRLLPFPIPFSPPFFASLFAHSLPHRCSREPPPFLIVFHTLSPRGPYLFNRKVVDATCLGVTFHFPPMSGVQSLYTKHAVSTHPGFPARPSYCTTVSAPHSLRSSQTRPNPLTLPPSFYLPAVF